jgi:glyoxylase-like metal-dependent hydrolase (beta-lactamase superfamily II)
VEPSLKYLHAIELPTPFPVGPVTVYLGDAPGEPLTLIDTGPRTTATQAALVAGLASLGYVPADLERIVVSHAHADHFGLVADLVDLSDAQVLTHPWNIPALAETEAYRRRRTGFYAELLREAGVPATAMAAVAAVTAGIERFGRPVEVTGVLDEADTLQLAGQSWQVLHTPGHASGLICLYEPESRTLISSDHLLADISSNPVVEPPPPGRAERLRSLVLYEASLQRVAGMDISQALPSHGPIIYDVPELVRQRLAFHERRLVRVLEAIRGGAQTTWAITQVLFPGKSPLDTFLAVSEVIGHLDLLEIRGQVVGEQVNGTILWQLTAAGEGATKTRSGPGG